MSVFDVAARAGVSIATVSRVLNNSRRVNPDIADQVRKAVAELNYFPQRVRRRSKPDSDGEVQTGSLAVIALGTGNREWFEMPVMAATIAAISRVSEQQHLAPLVTEMPDPAQINPILRRKEIIGALVLIPGWLDTRATRVLAAALPTVRIMGGQMAPSPVDHVTVDNMAVGFEAASYLREQGCQRVSFVTAEPGWHFIRQRWDGFASAAEEAGLTVEKLSGASLAEKADEIAARRPEGLFISRDEETVRMYRLLGERGVRPGIDVKIVSCDNEAVRLSTLHPRPPSIELGLEQLAQHAVRQVLWRARNRGAKPVRLQVNPQVVVPEGVD
jgi:LacI family transcriptional regulator